MEKHVQDVASYQHPDNVRMNVGNRNLGVVQELLEKRRERKVESRFELLLTKEDGTMCNLLDGRRVSIYQLNGDTIRNKETFAKFSLIEKLGRLPRTRASGTHACLATLFALTSRIG